MKRFERQCRCCGAQFVSGHPAAKWCNWNCKAKAAYYRRKDRASSSLVVQPTIVDESYLPAQWYQPPAGTDERFWKGTAIQRRHVDGFVNATAMCQANKREWFTYARSARTQEYIAALKAAPQICGTEVVQSVSGGTPALQGTWIHPRLAIDLARWISPAFAVWMDGWFLESLAAPALPPAPPLKTGVHVVAPTYVNACEIWKDTMEKELMDALSCKMAWELGRDWSSPLPSNYEVVVTGKGEKWSRVT